MKAEYDFSKGKRGAVTPRGTKVQKTVRLDPDVLKWLMESAKSEGIGYQTFLNGCLRKVMDHKLASLSTGSADDNLFEFLLRFQRQTNEHVERLLAGRHIRINSALLTGWYNRETMVSLADDIKKVVAKPSLFAKGEQQCNFDVSGFRNVSHGVLGE